MGILLALAIAWVYAKTAAGLAREWFSSPDASYGLVLIAVAALVGWQRRERCVNAFTARPSHGLAGVTALAGGLLLSLVGQLGADIFVTRLSLVAVLAGSLWFVAGAAVVRVLAAPLAFVLMAVPLPALLVNTVTLPLLFTSSRIVQGTLAAAGIPPFRVRNVVGRPSAPLEVTGTSRGLRLRGSVTAIAVLPAWTAHQTSVRPARARTGLPRCLTLVAAAVRVGVVMNGLRIAGIATA